MKPHKRRPTKLERALELGRLSPSDLRRELEAEKQRKHRSQRERRSTATTTTTDDATTTADATTTTTIIITAAATMSASSGLTTDAMTVPAARTKHGARRGRSKLQFAALALQVHARDYGDPRGVPGRILEERVNNWLLTNSEWRTAGHDRVSVDTIERAMKKLL
jgi:hypothetical protein